MVEPIQLPELPPSGPWASYVLVVVWLPLLMRLLFLMFPFRRAILRLAPHTGWALKALRELPIKGIGLLVVNEIMAFMIPPLLVLGLRMFMDPVGWQSWADVSNTGFAVLLLLLAAWLFFDFLRIARVRRMLKAIEKHDIERIQKVADAGLRTRTFLRRFAKKSKKDGKESTPSTGDQTTAVATSAAKRWGRRIMLSRRITPAGLLSSVALSASVQLARTGAGKLSDAVDAKLQKEFENVAQTNTKTLLTLFVRDLAMGIVPLVTLALLPTLLG